MSKLNKKRFTGLDFFFRNYLLYYSGPTVALTSFFALWIFEWLFIIEYALNYWSFSRTFFPYRTPSVLVICFMYWLYVWGVSVWRRTQYGRFTRGDRKLWFKGLAAFWVVEMSTIVGLYIAAAWMSWGPVVIAPRLLLISTKSFLFEATLFTYMIWLLYLLRFGSKWYSWNFQLFMALVIVFLTSMLVWRDIITLYNRDIITMRRGARWRDTSTSAVLYSLSSEWWMIHFLGKVDHVNSPYIPMRNILATNFKTDPFTVKLSVPEYAKFHWMPISFFSDWYNLAFKDFLIQPDTYEAARFIESNSVENPTHAIMGAADLTYDSFKFYPRRIGFYHKKMGMWFMFVILKMWHHIMLVIWWFFYILRLYGRKKNSYSLLSVAHFNIYSCFLISLLIYIYTYFPFMETFFRVKPIIRSGFHNRAAIADGIEYILSLLTFESSRWHPKKYLLIQIHSFSNEAAVACRLRSITIFGEDK